MRSSSGPPRVGRARLHLLDVGACANIHARRKNPPVSAFVRDNYPDSEGAGAAPGPGAGRVLPVRSLLVAPLLLVAAAIGPSSAVANDGNGDPIAALEAADSLLEQEKWSAALKALRTMLDEFPGDARLLPHLELIETRLVVARFRATTRKLKAANVIGPGATKLNPTSLSAEFKFDDTAGELWSGGNSVRWFEVDLAPPFSITMTAQGVVTKDGNRSIELRTSYFVLRKMEGATTTSIRVKPGCFIRNPDSNAGTASAVLMNVDAEIAEVVPGRTPTTLATGSSMADSFDRKMTLTASNKRVTFKCLGSTLKADTRLRSFRLGLFVGNAKDIKIKARLDRDWAERALEKAWDDALLDWAAAKHNRKRDLPEWMWKALENEVAGGSPDEDEIARTATWARGVDHVATEGDGRAHAISDAARAAFGAALDAVDVARWWAADRALTTAIDAEPGFVTARCWRAFVRTELRRWTDAASDASDVSEGHASAVLALARARIAVHDGDLGRAEDVLAEAAQSQLAGTRCTALLQAVRDVRAGPGFEKAEGAIVGRFRVVGEVSKEACSALARRLDDADRTADALAPAVPRDTAKRVVYAFDQVGSYDSRAQRSDLVVGYGSAGFLGHVPTLLVVADGEGADGDSADADRVLRQVVWWERLDQLVSAAPPWLAVGGAELIRDGDPRESLMDAAIDPRTFVSAGELLRTTEIAQDSPLRGQSREFVRFLATSDDATRSTLPADVLRALATENDWYEILADGDLAKRLEAAAAAFDAKN